MMSSLCHLAPEDRRKLFRALALPCHYKAVELAQCCQLHLRQLENYFEHDFGHPPQDWLNKERMLTAAHKMLVPEPIMIKEIAWELGISDPANFTRDFKRYFGFTPTELLRQKPFFVPHCAS